MLCFSILPPSAQTFLNQCVIPETLILKWEKQSSRQPLCIHSSVDIWPRCEKQHKTHPWQILKFTQEPRTCTVRYRLNWSINTVYKTCYSDETGNPGEYMGWVIGPSAKDPFQHSIRLTSASRRPAALLLIPTCTRHMNVNLNMQPAGQLGAKLHQIVFLLMVSASCLQGDNQISSRWGGKCEALSFVW